MHKISPFVDNLIEAFQCLPGVGPKSARRMVLHLLEKDREAGSVLAESLNQTLNNVGQCNECRIFSEAETCIICNDNKRDVNTLCVVESVSDVFAIEESNQYRGKYFILHGHLSPIDSMGPKELGLDQLFHIVKDKELTEVILATNSTLEGEATAHFIFEGLKEIDSLKISRLARGVPLGGELEYVDGGTIMHALSGRTSFK
ncbi:MAG TPA: recombination protein RecR [Gammaproteobacteria bacterium]|nr:recombination protein RecR [Gammaproteobacteria bacterium]HIO04678.1 recombination protein RecR [Gammaproteobacteria bacterium]